MTVEELDAASDAPRILELGEASLERAQVDLEHVSIALGDSRCKAFLDVQELRYRELPAVHLLGVHLNVPPTPDARPNREADERLVDHRLLRMPHDRRHLGFEKRRADLRLAEQLVVVHQVGPQQELPVHRPEAPEQKVDRLAVGLEQLFEQLVKDTKLLIEDKFLRDQMGKKAKAYAGANHSLDENISKIIKLIEK